MRLDRHFPFLHRDRNLSQIIEDAYQRGLITSDDATRLEYGVQVIKKETEKKS